MGNAVLQSTDSCEDGVELGSGTFEFDCARSGRVDLSVNTEGEGLSVGPAFSDAAGNVAVGTISGINIDRTAPTITFSGNAATYTVDQVQRESGKSLIPDINRRES